MRVYKREVDGFKMTAYNDSNAEWAISSKDSNGYNRTHWYDMRKYTLTRALEIHAEIYRGF
jgi:hypothetical protein